MPKRATHTFESEKDGVKDEALSVNYCMCCGESVLILGPEMSLNDVPRRWTDGALVLIKGECVFKLKTKEKGTVVIRRVNIDGEVKGYERQHRFGCWNCGVTLGYRAEASIEDAKYTYLLPDATGQQADLYLALYQVPQCIQPMAEQSVRVALEVATGQPKRALTHVADSDVGVAVCASAKEGLANAELLEYMARLLSVSRSQLQLSRGWSASSKFLLVSGLKAVDVFKRLKASVDTDAGAVAGAVAAASAMESRGGGEGGGDAFMTAGVASGVARRHWEEADDALEEDLAEAPSKKFQQFIK